MGYVPGQGAGSTTTGTTVPGATTGGPAVSGTPFPGTGQPEAGVSRQWWNAQVVTEKQAAIGPYRTTDIRPVSTKKATIGQMLLTFDNPDNWTPQAVDDLQSELWQAGFYKGKTPTFTPGERDGLTRSAFAAALKEASRGNEPLSTFLANRAAARKQAGLTTDASGASGSGTGKQVAQLSDPATLNSELDKAMTSVLGTGATDAQRKAFVAGVQHAQQAQTDSYNNGATAITGVDPTAQAAQFARAQDPVKADSRGAVKVASVIQQMLSGQMPAQSMSTLGT